jgi:hypothetical protein
VGSHQAASNALKDYVEKFSRFDESLVLDDIWVLHCKEYRQCLDVWRQRLTLTFRFLSRSISDYEGDWSLSDVCK